MFITVKGLTFGRFNGGGDGVTNPGYAGVVQRPNLTVRADVNFEYAEGQDYADGVRIANKRKVTGVSTTFELADLEDEIKTMLGWAHKPGSQTSGSQTTGGNEQAQDMLAANLITDQDPNYYGIGFYVWDEEPVTEADKYIAFWIYKSRFSADAISVATSTDAIAYQHQTINGRGVGVKLQNETRFTFVAVSGKFNSEADAIAWLQDRSGYTSGGSEVPVDPEETVVTPETGENP